jgi:CARDB/PLAT/LH2 domain
MPFVRGLVATFAVLLCAGAAPAQAFDTGPHADMTRDALMAEGFTLSSATIGAANNWFVDYYTNPGKNPHSGHASFLLGWTRLGLLPEDWPDHWVLGARRLHFDYEIGAGSPVEMPNLENIAGIEREWDRLEFRTRRLLGIYSRANDPLGVLSTMGAVLHSVQDFYAHSNWVEDPDPSGNPRLGGPGVASLGYGSHPTFFDVPPDVRDDLAVYTVLPDEEGTDKPIRAHGHWRSHALPFNPFDPNRGPFEPALNKDWPGRPDYQDAYVTAYFATRQWVRAMRTWLGNEPLWNRVMAMPQTGALSQDYTGAEEISQYSGHWQGGGEPCVRFINCSVRSGKAGSLSSLTGALRDFHAGPTSRYRRAFNQMIGEWALFTGEQLPPSGTTTPIPEYPDLPSSRAIQGLTRFVKLEVVGYRGIELGDPAGDAEIYANARMRGQPYTSTIIDSADSFSFRSPYHPFTWIRSVPTGNQASTPVTSMIVRVETGKKSGAGTDDDVSLRINGNLKFPLDKRLYDDFENGDVDSYSVPIGTATQNGLTVGDIDRVWIEKSPDGRSGAWFLHGVTLIVNGQAILTNRAIDTWLQKSNRTWQAPGFVRNAGTSDVVPVWLQVREDDFGPQDTGDINRYDRHTSLPIAYTMGTFDRQRVRGGSLLAGRLPLGDGDLAEATYQLSSFGVIPSPPPPPPPPPDPPPPPPPPVEGPAPDLIISTMTANTFTVRNSGSVAAGPFRVSVVSASGTENFDFPGLAVGESQERMFNRPCGETREARADSLNQVGESNETNNIASHPGPDFC